MKFLINEFWNRYKYLKLISKAFSLNYPGTNFKSMNTLFCDNNKKKYGEHWDIFIHDKNNIFPFTKRICLAR